MNRCHANLCGLLLAAGGSSRLGEPKQLFVWRGQTLVERAADLLLTVCGGGVTVVTGAESAAVKEALGGRRLNIVDNEDWQSGMSGSFAAGIAAIANTAADGVLIMLCDQPLLTADDITALTEIWINDPGSPAAARYSGVVGVPAIIPLCLVNDPCTSDVEGGAREFLRAREDVHTLDMPNAALDIDTPDDLGNLTNDR